MTLRLAQLKPALDLMLPMIESSNASPLRLTPYATASAFFADLGLSESQVETMFV